MNDVKILQIGEGNFIRAFFDYYIQLSNEFYGYYGSIVMCQPRTNTKVIDALKAQNNEFDVIVRGKLEGILIDARKRVTSIANCYDTVSEWDKVVETACLDTLEIIVSNTTEAGIEYVATDKMEDAPMVSYPAKLTTLLYERFKKGKSGVVILPLELIETNAETLKIYVLKHAIRWGLDDDFIEYIYNECSFCNTLVDRIVTGHIDGDKDPCSVYCEPYYSFVIQGDERCKKAFPYVEGMNIIFTDDTKPYMDSKVRILNGLHTMMVHAAYIHGFDIVRDVIMNAEYSDIAHNCLEEEILPTVLLADDVKRRFANSVIERFENPYIDHKLLDIALNSISKYQARCMSTVLDYYQLYSKQPLYMSKALAYLIRFYRGEFKDGKYIGTRIKNGKPEEYEIRDSKQVLEAFEKAYKTDNPVKAIMSDSSIWEIDMSKLDGFYEQVKEFYDKIEI